MADGRDYTGAPAGTSPPLPQQVLLILSEDYRESSPEIPSGFPAAILVSRSVCRKILAQGPTGREAVEETKSHEAETPRT